ncbi:tyrosine-type recombinase/integrase [Nocardia sp. CA-119907]|uniref:pentapeptide repeat-containing protein n=1 Tax=Nocardia sp. CA-119907 TaxID=3239973 RepID=UPI003D98A7F7
MRVSGDSVARSQDSQRQLPLHRPKQPTDSDLCLECSYRVVPCTRDRLYKASLPMCNLSTLDLADLDLSGTDLGGAKLARANLTDAKLADANLRGATFRRIVQRRAVPRGSDQKRRLGKVRPHDLRHTYAGRHVRGGVPIQQVQKLLGHASLRTTQRYASLGDSQWESVRGVLG